MIKIDMESLIQKVEAKRTNRITLSQIHLLSGVDKNTLSRIRNHPDVIPSSSVIDKLAQFFFFELQYDLLPFEQHEHLMQSVIKELVCIFPDRSDYWEDIPPGLKENPKVSLSVIWDIYKKLRTLKKIL